VLEMTCCWHGASGSQRFFECSDGGQVAQGESALHLHSGFGRAVIVRSSSCCEEMQQSTLLRRDGVGLPSASGPYDRVLARLVDRRDEHGKSNHEQSTHPFRSFDARKNNRPSITCAKLLSMSSVWACVEVC